MKTMLFFALLSTIHTAEALITVNVDNKTNQDLYCCYAVSTPRAEHDWKLEGWYLCKAGKTSPIVQFGGGVVVHFAFQDKNGKPVKLGTEDFTHTFRGKKLKQEGLKQFLSVSNDPFTFKRDKLKESKLGLYKVPVSSSMTILGGALLKSQSTIEIIKIPGFIDGIDDENETPSGDTTTPRKKIEIEDVNIEDVILDRKQIATLLSEITGSLKRARRERIVKAVPDTLPEIDREKDPEAYRAASKNLLLDRKKFGETLTWYRMKLKMYPDGYPANDPLKAEENAKKFGYSEEEKKLLLIQDILKSKLKK